MKEISQETLVSAIRGATQEVFSTMLCLDVEACDSYVDLNAPGPSHGVVALVGLAGRWVGTGSFSCSAELACKIHSLLLMTETEAINEEVLDAVAEVTNMIIGNVKTVLEEEFGPLGLSIPTVIYGRNFVTRAVGKNEWVVVPFMNEGQRMEVQICLAPNKDGDQTPRAGFSNPHVVRA